jgi:hypothetical protein
MGDPTLAGQEGLEPPTTGFGDRDSGQLSYCPVLYDLCFTICSFTTCTASGPYCHVPVNDKYQPWRSVRHKGTRQRPAVPPPAPKSTLPGAGPSNRGHTAGPEMPP